MTEDLEIHTSGCGYRQGCVCCKQNGKIKCYKQEKNSYVISECILGD